MDRFVTTVLRDVPGCPNTVIKEEVLSSAIEFCERSWIYTTKLTESIASGDESLTLSLPENTLLVGIDRLRINDTDFHDIEHDDGVITFDEAAAQDYTIYVYVALKPGREVTSLPNLLYNNWYQAIAAGAKAKLMIMPEKPWSNPQLAAVHSDVFETGVNKAMSQAFAKTMPTEKSIGRRQWL